LLVPDLAAALAASSARRCVTLNLLSQDGETDGFGLETYLQVLAAYAPDLRVDVVLAERSQVQDQALLRKAAAALGAELALADVCVDDGDARHDVARLASAYSEIMQ